MFIAPETLDLLSKFKKELTFFALVLTNNCSNYFSKFQTTNQTKQENKNNPFRLGSAKIRKVFRLTKIYSN